MEANSPDSPEYKFNPSSSSNEGTSRSGASNNQSQDKSRDRKSGLKRKHPDSREKLRERPVLKQEDESKDSSVENQYQMPQSQGQVSQALPTMVTPASFPNYYYGNAEQFSADPSRRPYPMMPPQYSLYPMNQWVNPMDGMSSNNMSFNAASAIPVSTGIDMSSATGTMMNSMPPYMMNMSADGSMYGMMGGMGNYCMFPNEHLSLAMPPMQKETITLTKSVWYPPSPTAPPPSLRERPNGCRTVFVGGLPEKITEEIVREAFEQYGEINTIRMSKKNFCHIRFAREEHVERALYLSGYRMKIDNKDDASYSGRIHVDYAFARDDQYEYECAQRVARRIARHRAIGELETKETSAPPIPLFSEIELQNLLNQFRSGKFKGSVQVLVSWLEKGEVSKRNGGTFFSIIQSLNYHVRRLLNDKSKYEDELSKAKLMLRQKMFGISLQLKGIEKVFETTKCPKVWDHFSKAQRKNIELWKKQTSEIKKANSEELIEERVEDEMDVSDEDAETNKNPPQPVDDKARELREKKESLQKRLAAALLELEKAKSERKKEQEKLNEESQQVNRKLIEKKKELERLKAIWAAKSGNARSEAIPSSENNSEASTSRALVPWTPYRTPSGTLRLCGRDFLLLALISGFLHVHPFGAHIDYICSYLVRFDPTVATRYVENLLRLFPAVFKEETTGIGATLERNWHFLGFNSNS